MGDNELQKPKIISFKKDEIIYKEDSINYRRLYIIKSGKIAVNNVLKINDAYGILETGDLIGVIEAFSGNEWMTSGKALEHTELLEIDINYISHYIKNHPNLILNIIEFLISYNNKLNKALNIVLDSDNEDLLFYCGNYYMRRKEFVKAHHIYSKYLELYHTGKHAEEAKMILSKLVEKNKYPKVRNDNNHLFFKKGMMIFSEYEYGIDFYIIEKGKVVVSRIIDDIEIPITILGEGSILGETAIIEKGYRSANAVAFEDSLCLRVNKDNFQQVFNINPSVAIIILKKYAFHIWRKHRKLENKLIKTKKAKVFDFLLYEAQINNVDDLVESAFKYDTSLMELANKYGLDIQSLNEYLDDLVVADIISIKKNQIILKKPTTLKNVASTLKTNIDSNILFKLNVNSDISRFIKN